MAYATELDRSEIERVVHDVILSILPAVPATAITGDKHIKELGADSVDRVEIILSIMDRLKIHAPMSSFSDIPNIDALVDYLCTLRSL